MSADDDFENALWNNNFYSSPAVLTESSSSSHITNLRKSVNLPNSASIQSLNGHLAASDDTSVSKEAEKPEPGSKTAENLGPGSSFYASAQKQTPAGNRTSLMKVSPSMKALENVLNSRSSRVSLAEVIAEEEDEEEADYEPKPQSTKPQRDTYDLQFAQPGSRVSAYSLSTFHTARSSDTLAARPLVDEHSRQGSVSTIEAPSSLPREDESYLGPISIPSFSRPSQDENVRCSMDDGGSPERRGPGSVAQDATESAYSGKSEIPSPKDASLACKPLHAPRMSVTKGMVSSTSCPVLSDAHNHVSNNLSNSATGEESAGNRKVNVRKTSSATDPETGSPHVSETASDLPEPTMSKQAPVRSLLGSPLKTSEKPNAKLPSKPSMFLDQASSQISARNSPVKSSSAFATPRHEEASSRDISEKQVSKENASKSSGFRSRRNSSDSDAQKSKASTETKSGSHKRFSFRGLFKIKSKNHSLSELKNIDEEPSHRSKPVKISAKSFSTPNMAALAKGPEDSISRKTRDQKPEPKRRFFNRRNSRSGELDKDIASLSEKPSSPIIPETLEKQARAPSAKTPQLNDVSPPNQFNPVTPGMSSSLFSADTPLTACLEPKRNTIREVDDSDYSPNVTRDSPTPSKDSESIPVKNSVLPVQKSESLKNHGDSSPQKPQISLPNFSPDAPSTSQFGSPFKVSFPSSQVGSGPRVPDSPRQQPPQSPSRSTNSRVSNDQLAGEALFPKSLDAHEVESIVSLERSRSMRSIRSNKRSSFLNYNGSDENIVLGKHLNNLSQTSMKRSGSILKNSPSIQSLKYQSIDTAIENSASEHAAQNVNIEALPTSGNDQDFADFIEFTDYIDLDNLDFSGSPVQEPSNLPGNSPIPSFEIYVKNEYGDPSEYLKSPALEGDSPMNKDPTEDECNSPRLMVTENNYTTISGEYDGESNSNGLIVSERASQNSKNKSLEPEASNSAHVHATKASNTEKATSSPNLISSDPALSDISTKASTAPLEPASITSPLDKTYEFAMDGNRRSEVSDQKPRPVSMSFRGFSGSAFKNRVIPQSGSHQSIHFDEDSTDDLSAVGQGFGSSDEDSDYDEGSDERFDETFDSRSASEKEEHNRDFQGVHEISNPGAGTKKLSSFDRRQQHIQNVLDLQPPPSTLPFHHNRIPSISDQGSISSPKSLSSFISRMRRSPMASPQLAPLRPTVQFSSRIVLYDTYHHDEYDRHPEIATCNQLTPQLAQKIKEELNELKSNMEVHEDSVCYTQFF